MKKIATALFCLGLGLSSFNSQPLHAQLESKLIKSKNDFKFPYFKTEEVDSLIKMMISKFGDEHSTRLNNNVRQVASLWFERDGNFKVFSEFCLNNFITDFAKGQEFFNIFQKNYETIQGYNNKISLDLKSKVHLDMGEITSLDEDFAAYEPTAHFIEDMFASKIAFKVLLNFKSFSFAEKEMAVMWIDEDWAYCRLGDVFAQRIPAELNQQAAKAQSDAENYIASYNIYMGNLINDKGEHPFPKDLRLVTHWGLRDELKSHYGKENGLDKQKMVYQVMKRIVDQSIPANVVNSNKVDWNPYSNIVKENSKEISNSPEPCTRYKMLLDNFIAQKEIDKFSPNYENYIARKFEGEMEMSVKEVEYMFDQFLKSKSVKDVANLIQKRLNRKLEAFDIWYDGFKSRIEINEDDLSKKTKAKYPNVEAFSKDLPNILEKLGFDKERADYIAEKVVVDPSRGAGHAWGAMNRGLPAHLRTRFQKDGMDYKGYNIAVHEFGHNVEQTFSLNNVNYYMLQGVPNNAFTEAIAFLFQSRDLQLLGVENKNPDKKHLYALDNFWGAYEIMGVSLVDIRTWKWLYQHPNASKEELRDAVVSISKEVWNEYYAPVLGGKDETILGIYSHMIDYPLYLSAYPIGHIIEFQLEKNMEGKNFADEITRISSIGRKIPHEWMKKAVGSKVKADDLMKAADEAVRVLNK